MDICNLVLIFESVDKILWCDDSNETSSAVLVCFFPTNCYFVSWNRAHKSCFEYQPSLSETDHRKGKGRNKSRIPRRIQSLQFLLRREIRP